MSHRRFVATAVIAIGCSAGARELICGKGKWAAMCTYSGTILPGTEVPGEIPSLDTSGLVWIGDDAFEFAGARGPGRTVDAVTLTYAQGGPVVSHTNLSFDPVNRQVEIPWSLARPHMSIAHYTAQDGPILVEMSYYVPYEVAGFGQTIMEYRITNTSPATVSEVRLLRSLNPNIQRNGEPPIDALAMDIVAGGAAVAMHPSGATIVFGAPGDLPIVSIEGDLVTDPLEIIGSPRDPNGLVEDTAINIVLNPVKLGPGDSYSATMLMIVAADPLTAIEAFQKGGVPFCLADCEGDGDLDVFDFLCFQGSYAVQGGYADFEFDGDWDVFDFLAFQNAFAQGCK